MKLFNLRPLAALALLLGILGTPAAYSQCPGGQTIDSLAFDTTINFSSGRFTALLKFPKFDPTSGMVTCAKITMTMSGTLNTLQFENQDNTTNSASATFHREDTISGPGLSSAMTNSETQGYGPYSLAPNDGVFGSGPDYVHVGPESIFTTSKSITITDSANLAIFYGPPGDSLSYTYSVFSQTQTSVTGNWLGGASTSGWVNYKIQFCRCPKTVLPINIYDFSLSKIDASRVNLYWKTNSDQENYYYQVEYSLDGTHFYPGGIVQKQDGSNTTVTYNYLYTAESASRYYFRIRQVFASGRTLVSIVKTVDFGSALAPKFSLYPNPSNGVIGIKFDKNTSGKVLVQISNAQGQTVLKKELEVQGESYQQVATLQAGIYWLRLTDVTSRLSSVNQLLIK
ncbi:MAG TPA: choice-of-anchor E domain-containing protein [Chitinophagaceae bacterium]|nr:choice-of-anchor E domain-containing protein [Chitinophagaceae bacterium]